MLFNSLEFAIFLPIVFLSYWFLFRGRLVVQNILLLISSYIFYGWWDWRFLTLIVASTLVDYLLGLRMVHSQSDNIRKRLLLVSIVFNLSILGFFKYYNFFVESFVELLTLLGLDIVNTTTLEIILPVGISFYTFQTMSYTIDIYNRKIEPSKNIIAFAAFVAFFPQLVAGPIERAKNLLPQMLGKRNFNYKQGVEGIFLILNGLFRKIVLADSFAVYVNQVWSSIETASSLALIFGVIFFGLQIYLDFSGYSKIARGIAKLLGFELMVNFDRPYLARNILIFWGKWHISLSTWFRDYLYIPLGGNRVSTSRWAINITLVFLLSGLWHGANWTFIVWAIIHVSMYFINKFTPSLSNLFTTQLGVFIAWIFFRSQSIEEGIQYCKSLITNDFFTSLPNLFQGLGPASFTFLLLNFVMLYLLYRLEDSFEWIPGRIKTLTLAMMVVLISLLFEKNSSQFIYFQF